MDIRRKHRSDCEHVYVIRTSRVPSPDRTWPDRWISEMHESRRVRLGTTVEYIERKFKTKAWERHVVKNPWRSPVSRTGGTKSPSRSEALRFIDSSKSPPAKIDGSLVNFRRRLSNRHGRPQRMLTWTFEGNTDQTVSTST